MTNLRKRGNAAESSPRRRPGPRSLGCEASFRPETWIPACPPRAVGATPIGGGRRAFAGMTISAVCFLALFEAPVFADSASVQLRLEVEPKEATIGDRIDVTLSVVHSTGAAMSPLSLPEPFGAFELLDHSASPPAKGPDGRLRQEHTLVLTTFSTGTQTVPPITLSFVLADGEDAQAQTAPVDIRIRSLLEEKGDAGGLMPLKGFVNVRSRAWLWALLGLVVAAGLAALVAAWRKRRPKRAAEAPPAPPPDVEAWDALHRLESEGLIESGRLKEFYSGLSVVLRRYIERRFDVPALDRTTTELLAELRDLRLGGDVYILLKSVFEQADLVKFAQWAPPVDAVDADVQTVKRFISLTAPAPNANGAERAAEERIPV